MDEAAIIEGIRELGADVRVAPADGSFFFFRGENQMFPFATLVTSNQYDPFSNLDRPGVFRLNFGVGRAAFRARFGATPGEFDFTALDRLMPHPVYGSMFWMCVLNPGVATRSEIQPLLVEAYERAAPRESPAEV